MTTKNKTPREIQRKPLLWRVAVALGLTFGIYSAGRAATVPLTWNANTESDLAGYRLFISEKSLLYAVRVQDSVGSTFTTPDQTVTLSDTVLVAPDTANRYRLENGLPAAGAAELSIPSDQNVKELQFVRLNKADTRYRGSPQTPEIDAVASHSPILLYDIQMPGRSSHVFKRPVRFVMSYPDNDGGFDASGLPRGDGIVDGTRIRVSDLAVFYYNTLHRKWDKMTGTVNTKNKTVIARTTHFSLFALFDAQSAADAAFTLGEAFAYPNPARGGRNPILHFETGIADEVTLRIYDSSGELKHTISMGNSPAVVNDKYAYEAVWDVSNMASGIYVVAASAKKDGQTLRRNFKLAVVK